MTNTRPVHDTFEECLELVFQGEPIEDCLRRFPALATELRPLLETAVAARKAAAVQPGPEFRDRARQQLLAAQRERDLRPAGRPGFVWNWQPAWAVTLAAFLLVLMAGSGTVFAAAGSMPGQPLYAVKQATASVRLALTPSATAKAELYASLADQRVGEIVYLAGKSQPVQLQQATRDLDLYLTRISELSGGVSQSAVLFSKNSGAMADATAPSTTLLPERSGVPSTMPPAVTVTGSGTGAAGTGAAAEGTTEMATATDRAPQVLSARAMFKVRISAQSVDNTARLKAALADATAEAKPALLRAIAVSESGYEMALQSLEGD